MSEASPRYTLRYLCPIPPPCSAASKNPRSPSSDKLKPRRVPQIFSPDVSFSVCGPGFAGCPTPVLDFCLALGAGVLDRVKPLHPPRKTFWSAGGPRPRSPYRPPCDFADPFTECLVVYFGCPLRGEDDYDTPPSFSPSLPRSRAIGGGVQMSRFSASVRS